MFLFYFRGNKLNVSMRLSEQSLLEQHLAGVVELSRDAETAVGNRFYNYYELHPTTVSDNDTFSQLIGYLAESKSVSS